MARGWLQHIGEQLNIRNNFQCPITQRGNYGRFYISKWRVERVFKWYQKKEMIKV
jgi:hypothetical protein